MVNYDNRRTKVVVGQLQTIGATQTINGETISVVSRDADGYITKATGTAVYTTQNGQAVYAKEAEYIRTNAVTGKASRYGNIGTTSNSSFNLIAGVTSDEITLAEGNLLIGNASGVATALDGSPADQVIAGNGTTMTSKKVTSAMVADSAGLGGLYVRKMAIAVYDFAVDGGTAGTITLADTATLPDKAIVKAIDLEVITTCQSATDAATIALSVPVDGALTGAIAINDGTNPWDQGVSAPNTANAVKLTGARALQIDVAGGEDLTAGKIVFAVEYYVSQ